MASMVSNAAKSAGSAVGKAAGKAASKGTQDRTLQKGARRDPELYVLLAVMSGAFSLAGYYFGRKPTSAMSETDVSMASSAMPWQVDDPDQDDDSKNFKYQYHPRGDKNARPKKAPSALNTVIIPNVTLPKDIHDAFNKWGKDGY